MKKISFLTKTLFHISNILLILIYLYPGSILGWFFYGDIRIQPQLNSNFSNFSPNHFYAFLILSLLGIGSYYKDKIKVLFLYLFFISIFLELCHVIIPLRNFEYKDLISNFLGVLLIFLLFKFNNFLKSKND